LRPLVLRLGSSLLLGALLGAAAPAQTFGPYTDVTLPQVGVGAADHATVALDGAGDVLVAFQVERPDGRHDVEVVGVVQVADRVWEVLPPQVVGDAGAGVLGRDECHKPDVVALGDGTFAVAWPRLDADDDRFGRIESVRVALRDPGTGQPRAFPQVDAPAPGVGWVADPDFTPGRAGGMPDLAHDPSRPGECTVVYADEEWDLNVLGASWREYALKAVRLDWNRQPGSSQWADGPFTLIRDVGADQDVGEALRGGLVLPDALFDDWGRLVVACEEFLLPGHQLPLLANPLGRVRVLRLEPRNHGYELLEDRSLLGDASDRRQRRPNLASHHDDGDGRVLVAWMEVLPGNDGRVHFERLVYLDADGGSIGPFPEPWAPGRNGESDALPSCARGLATSLAVATRDDGASWTLLAAIGRDGGAGRMVPLPTAVAYPWRPALDLREVPGAQQSGLMERIVLTYEGSDVDDEATYRIHLIVAEIAA